MIDSLEVRFSTIDLLDCERLDIGGPPYRVPETLGPTDWGRVDRVVQESLRLLANRVHQGWPEIRSRPGRTSGRYFHLYSYCVFDLGDAEEIDPIVAGVNFERDAESGRIRARADIGGESTGRIDYEAAPVLVPDDQASVLAVACRLASDLAGRAKLIAGQVLERHAPPTY